MHSVQELLLETGPSRFSFSILSNKVVDIIIICGLLTQIEDLNQAYAIALIVFFSLTLLILSFAIWQQPQDDTIQTFKVYIKA
jgi:hypothetical protein